MTPEELEAALKLARKAIRSRNPNTAEAGQALENLAKYVRELHQYLPHVAEGNYAQGTRDMCGTGPQGTPVGLPESLWESERGL